MGYHQNNHLHKTKPIKCWDKMKELRRSRFRNTWEAQDRGDIVVMGMPMISQAIPCGIGETGDYADVSYGPYYAGISRDPKKMQEMLEYVESKGYKQQLCGAMRIHLAQILKGMAQKSPEGKTILPDFVYQIGFCAQVGFMGRIASEHLGVPYIYADYPYHDTPRLKEYYVANLNENIEEMEKVTGQKYDDEKLIEATRNEWDSMAFWSKVCELNKAIPAPLDNRHLSSLRLPCVTLKHRPEVVEFYKELLDEVKDRVKEGISARGYEKKRLTMEMFPWISPHLMRYMDEEYGAAIVAGDDPFIPAAFEVDDKAGIWTALPTTEELDVPLRDREDALKAQAELFIHYEQHGLHCWNIEQVVRRPITMAKDWNCDGLIIGKVRDCFQQHSYQMETKLIANEMNIPVMIYDMVISDPRQFDEKLTKKKFDIFIQSLGLNPLTEAEKTAREKMKKESHA